ncbi:MAG: TatD family hydrolase [Planctomycetota bacterium]
MASLFDTHAHLDQADFDPDRAEILRRAAAAGVDRVLAVGVTAESSAACLRLAEEWPGRVSAAVGIQPNYVHQAEPGDWDRIVELARSPAAVALGETGLDRYWDDAPFPLQQDYFDRHLRLSQQTGLPFVVHMRECEEDILEMLREARRRGPLRGVMHSFTGPAEMAAECVELGLHISFAGMVTFKKSNDLRDVAKTVPLDRLLVETDSPYLSPEPVRKVRRNEPAHVRHTAELLAKVRGETFEQLAEATTANAVALFSR